MCSGNLRLEATLDKEVTHYTLSLSLMSNDRSQCSTLVRNTVVRATFKVNGKPPISGGRSPLTP